MRITGRISPLIHPIVHLEASKGPLLQLSNLSSHCLELRESSLDFPSTSWEFFPETQTRKEQAVPFQTQSGFFYATMKEYTPASLPKSKSVTTTPTKNCSVPCGTNTPLFVGNGCPRYHSANSSTSNSSVSKYIPAIL